MLSGPQLLEVYGWLRETAERLADPSHQQLLEELEQPAALGWDHGWTARAPLRAFANRSIVQRALVRPDCLAAERQPDLDTAIVEHRRISWSATSRWAPSPTAPTAPFGSGRCRCCSTPSPGTWPMRRQPRPGARADPHRTARSPPLAAARRGNRRSEEAHPQALQRLERLLQLCGGIYFGDDLEAQLRSGQPRGRSRERQTGHPALFLPGLVLRLHP